MKIENVNVKKKKKKIQKNIEIIIIENKFLRTYFINLIKKRSLKRDVRIYIHCRF